MNVDELAVAIQQGNTDLCAELWQGVKKFVYKEANRYSAIPAFASFQEDFYQAGYIAMVVAVEGYEPEKGSFINWLALHLKTAFAEATNRQSAKQKSDPLNNAISIYAPAYTEDAETTIADTQIDESASRSFEEVEHRVFISQLHEALESVISGIEKAEREVIQKHYFEGKDAREAAQESGTTVQTALRHIRKSKDLQNLKEFVELQTPYYSGTSYAAFERTRSSSVERAVIWREAFTEGKKESATD